MLRLLTTTALLTAMAGGSSSPPSGLAAVLAPLFRLHGPAPPRGQPLSAAVTATSAAVHAELTCAAATSKVMLQPPSLDSHVHCSLSPSPPTPIDAVVLTAVLAYILDFCCTSRPFVAVSCFVLRIAVSIHGVSYCSCPIRSCSRNAMRQAQKLGIQFKQSFSKLMVTGHIP